MRPFKLLLPLLLLSIFLPACSALQQIAALKSVDFRLDRAADIRLAGVNMDQIRSFSDLSLFDAARLTTAVTRRELPLSFTLHVEATNPSDHPVTARMVGMDWALLLDDRETITGVFNDPRALPPGSPVDIPVTIELNLIEFFDQNARDLFELVQAIAGDGGSPKRIGLRARPTIDTPIGPITYPNPITILSREVGG